MGGRCSDGRGRGCRYWVRNGMQALQEKLVLVLRLLEGGKPLSDWATAIRSRV